MDANKARTFNLGKATFEAESEDMCFIGYAILENKFNKEFKRYRHYDAYSGSDRGAW